MQVIASSLSGRKYGVTRMTIDMSHDHPGGMMAIGWPLKVYPSPRAMFRAAAVYSSLSPAGTQYGFWSRPYMSSRPAVRMAKATRSFTCAIARQRGRFSSVADDGDDDDAASPAPEAGAAWRSAVVDGKFAVMRTARTSRRFDVRCGRQPPRGSERLPKVTRTTAPGADFHAACRRVTKFTWPSRRGSIPTSTGTRRSTRDPSPGHEPP